MSAPEPLEPHAAGAVLWRLDASGQPLVALVHRPRYDDWSLPKGTLKAGETAPVAAVREVAEETGFSCAVGRFLHRASYRIGEDQTIKTVDYFSACAGPGEFHPGPETDRLRWASAREAGKLLRYPSDLDVLAAFTALPTPLTTLLLVRHAKAGRREDWIGDDDLRPLSEAGRHQADALRTMLRSFAPEKVLAAPRLRCVQTVQGCAEDIGVPVRHEPLLSEEGYQGDPVLAMARLRAIAADGGTSLACSQGAVIPYLVDELARRDGVELPDAARASQTGGKPVASKKGSLWLLSLRHRDDADGPQLVAADYFASPLPARTSVER